MLEGKRLAALEALFTCSSKRAAAKQAKIDEKTLKGYLREPEFLAEYRRIYNEIFEEAAFKAQKAMGDAIEVLQEVSKNKKAPQMARVSAAANLIRSGYVLRDETNYRQRLEALEDATKREL